uniref:Pleiotropic regulator 1 n=1 Tax=Henneguya salminicola TaxID=69463 RepID=A0A6G3MEL9_HENSL
MTQEVKVIAESALLSVQESKSQNGESAIPFSHGLIPRKAPIMPKPMWHPPWKLMRVISGHTGWVRCMTVEPGNTWFATGSCDRMIKIWDLASGTLKLSLTGHISTVRGLAASPHHPYLFSCGEDKQIKCWDLEQNKAIRHYHGHLHAIYCMAQHPTIDILATGSRDATIRIWDIRTKACAFTLTGHTNTVASVCAQATLPQIISGSHDSTIRLWDLTAGKSYCTMTNHKKSVRSVIIHPQLNCMSSASPENIKEWKLPHGDLIQTLKGHNAIINALAINEDDVLVSGGDNGSLHFWDWKTGYNFDTKQTIVQPGSLDSEAGIFALGYDLSGSRLISCEADKSIKIYKEDEEATEETNPIKYKTDVIRSTRF